MKAIILAAGMGTRLGKYTESLPKGMLKVFDKPILEHQIDILRKYGFDDITIVRGYQPNKIPFTGVSYFTNEVYDVTNMVESLFCAEEKLVGDVLVCYSDILFDDRILKEILADKSDIGVVMDLDWKDYWQARYGDITFDTESFKLGAKGEVVELGTADPKTEDIDGRYVGLIKFSSKGIETAKRLYHEAKKKFSGNPWINGRIFEKAYMTDFLQETIRQGNPIFPIKVHGGWLEFDTTGDYEKSLEWNADGTIKKFISLNSTVK